MTPRKNIAGSLVLILFSIVFLLYTTRYPLDTRENPGPAVFPLVLGAILLALASWQLIQAFMDMKASDVRTGRAHSQKSLRRFFRENRNEASVVYMTALLILYILMVRWIGFYVSSFLLVIFASRLIDAKGWLKPLVLSAGLNFFSYLLFGLWLKLAFPRGLLF